MGWNWFRVFFFFFGIDYLFDPTLLSSGGYNVFDSSVCPSVIYIYCRLGSSLIFCWIALKFVWRFILMKVWNEFDFQTHHFECYMHFWLFSFSPLQRQICILSTLQRVRNKCLLWTFTQPGMRISDQSFSHHVYKYDWFVPSENIIWRFKSIEQWMNDHWHVAKVWKIAVTRVLCRSS